MTRPSRKKTIDASAVIDSEEDEQERVLPAAVRERNRAVAEREASRLARPERRKVGSLGHATKSKSAVTSTPSGVHALPKQPNAGDELQEWCGPFSVARQVRHKAVPYWLSNCSVVSHNSQLRPPLR
jgi:hypothetical protein